MTSTVKHTSGHARRIRALSVFLAVLLAVTVLSPVTALAATPPWDEIVDILHDTMDSEDFYWNLDQEPLACQSDENGDGVWELLMVYPCRNDDGLDYVMEKVWLIDGSKSKCVGSGVLFNEIGGNSGTLTLAEKDGDLYVLVKTSEPDGADFNDFYDIYSLAEGEAALGDEYCILSCTGTYGAEDDGEYVIGKEVVDRDEFEDYLDSFDPCYTLDIWAGPDGDVIPFNVMLS